MHAARAARLFFTTGQKQIFHFWQSHVVAVVDAKAPCYREDQVAVRIANERVIHAFFVLRCKASACRTCSTIVCLFVCLFIYFFLIFLPLFLMEVRDE